MNLSPVGLLSIGSGGEDDNSYDSTLINADNQAVFIVLNKWPLEVKLPFCGFNKNYFT